jgi:hypothetical protein
MPISASTSTAQWNLAAAATVAAGAALVLLQPQWWEGALYALFQASVILWLRPGIQAPSSTDLIDALTDEIRCLHRQEEQRCELLGRVLPLWNEQLQLAQDQLNMPGACVTDPHACVRINLSIDAVRADMQRLHEILCDANAERIQKDHWLSAFAAAQPAPARIH